MLTDRELQTLRNMGNEAEEAADEIENLRADLANARGARDFALAVAREAQEIARMAQAATPAAAPLTDAQIERLYNNLPPSIQQDARSRLAFIRIGRAVEAAHGIGKGKESA